MEKIEQLTAELMEIIEEAHKKALEICEGIADAELKHFMLGSFMLQHAANLDSTINRHYKMLFTEDGARDTNTVPRPPTDLKTVKEDIRKSVNMLREIVILTNDNEGETKFHIVPKGED